jgi:O-antigen/teichoic acid export membrane protein
VTEADDESDTGLGEGARLVRHGLANAIGRLAIGAIGIVLVPIMLDGIGAEAYGLWIAALALGEIAASIDLGLGWAITREVARDPTGAASSRFVSTAGVAIARRSGCAVPHWLRRAATC